MRRDLRTLFCGLALCAASAVPARASEDTAYWQNLNVTVKLTSDLRASSETSIRTSDARGLYQIQETVMIGYKPSKTVTIWAGYVHSAGYSHGDFTVLERRFRQQINVDNIARVGPFQINGRARLEQRWRDGVSGTGWRLRPSLRASAPLAGKVSIAFQHESFVNLNTTAFQGTDGLERMRNSVTVIVPVAKPINVELGYMNQHAFVRNGPDSVDHVLMTTLSASF